MARSSFPAYEAEEKKRKQLDKGGVEFGYVKAFAEEDCPALSKSDIMKPYGTDGMKPAGAYPLNKDPGDK